MTIYANHALGQLLDAAVSRIEYCSILESGLGPTRRVIASRDGTVFRNCALTGAFTVSGQGQITNVGNTSNTTVSLAANLATGSSMVRIEGNGNWITGTLGLTGSGCDFILSTNPTTTNGFAFSTVLISPPESLPIEANDAIGIMSIQFGVAGSMQTAVAAELVYSGMAVGNGSATQSRWRCNPITVPAWQRVSGTESLTGNNITYHVFPGLDSNGRADVWLFAEAAYDAAGSFGSGGATRVASNREFGKISLSIQLSGVAQTLWDGSTLYQCDFPRATSMRWQSAFMDWDVTTANVSQLISTGKIMRHKSQGLLTGATAVGSYTDQLTYEPFKVFGAISQASNVGDMPRAAASGGERNAVGLVHEAMARMIAEVGTHANEAYATANRVNTLKNLAETAAQVSIAGGVISTSTYKLVDPGNDVNGPFVYALTNGSSFVGRLLPMPGAGTGADVLNMSFDVAHPPNIISYYAYQLSKDPFHLFLTQSMAATCVGATTNTGTQRGADGKLNLIANSEERAHWWGLKCLVEAWASTPDGTMPAPFLSRSFFETAITNTLTRIRTFMGNSSSWNNKIMDQWGALQTLDPTSTATSTTYKGVHPLSLDYGNFSLCHIRRLGYTAMDDVITWHARNVKIRATAGGNYFSNERTVSIVAIIAASATGSTLEYSDGAGYATWYPPTGTKHGGNYPFSEWYTERSGSDGGNYTFQFLNALACYKHMVDAGYITLDWNPSTEYTALLSRIGAPVGGESQFPVAYTKHYYDF